MIQSFYYMLPTVQYLHFKIEMTEENVLNLKGHYLLNTFSHFINLVLIHFVEFCYFVKYNELNSLQPYFVSRKI